MYQIISKNLTRVYRLSTVPIRRRPDYLIIGAQKSGTTTLFNILSRHPEVLNPKNKEMHFFDRRDIDTLRDYRAEFPISLKRITGEATPSYIFYPGAAEEVRSILPNTRIIAVLRNPVDRAYSHYWMRVRRGKEPLSFEEALERESSRMKNAWEQYYQDPDNHAEELLAHSYLERGLYAEQLERWLEAFGESKVLVLSYERLISDATSAFSQVCKFLGISKQNSAASLHLNAGYYEPMDKRTRARVSEFFSAPNRRLYEIVGDDFGWDC